ncbi:uncharacterized protein LOC119829240 [Zerene cesonia]|uniref:uncharacterized protein LOC119829240 n=1 Tax=Zerene cesonia TaxID=33412 RepID=UPI0018E4EE44|nr:uncharacterized protein LOC119829240 [Zerene cesonia]
MISKLTVLLAALAVSNAVPVWMANPYYSGMFLRHPQPPSIAFGIGSGFSSDFGGIKHTSSYGHSFQTGNAQAYGGGSGTADGNTFARGVGYAQTFPQTNLKPQYQYRHPVPQDFQQASAVTFNSGGRSFNSASAQSFGNFASAVSSAQSVDGIGSAVSAVQHNGQSQSAISSVNSLGRNGLDSTIATTNSNGHGFGSAITRADISGGYQSAISSTQGHGNFNNYGQGAVAQNVNGYRTSNAYNVNQGSIQNSVAINGPGIQVAQTYSNNNGYY